MSRSPKLRRLGRFVLRHRCAVLMYHGVVPKPLGVFNWCHLPISNFRAQMLYLKAHYRAVPLIEVVERVRSRRSLPELSVCITFDDAFRTVLDFAFPILRELELPFTVFVVSQLLDNGDPPWPERIYSALVQTSLTSLTWRDQTWNLSTPAERSICYEALTATLVGWPPDQRDLAIGELIQMLSSSAAPVLPWFATLQSRELEQMTSTGLCHVAAHSETHAVLTRCSAERLRNEVRRARERLSKEKGYVDILAYPHGCYHSEVLRETQEAGFRGAVTVRHRLCRSNDSPYAIPRIGIGANMDMNQFSGTLLAFY